MKTKTSTLYGLLSFLVIGAGLFAYSFTGAWTPPPGNPPSQNTDAPINVGGEAQVKAGNMGANILAAQEAVWSDQYCNLEGTVCTTPSAGSMPDEIVYLPSPVTIYQANTTGGVTRTYNLQYNDHPVNIKRAFLTANLPSYVKTEGYGQDSVAFRMQTAVTLSQPVYNRTIGAGMSAGTHTYQIAPGGKLSFRNSETAIGDAPWAGGGNTNIPFPSVAMEGYECHGECRYLDASAGTCEVRFAYNIGGVTGSRIDTVSAVSGSLQVILYSHHSDWRPSSYAIDVEVASRSWRTGSLNLDHRKVKLGYMLPGSTLANSSEITTRDLPLTVGASRNMSGSHVSSYTATVQSCTN
ncbi:MAG: hypothetical protein ACK42D_02400 [Candidatus Paceibacteria bacterium]